MNREVIGAGRQGGTSLNVCDFIPMFENPKKSHLATLLFSKLRTFDFSRRKINILGAILYFFWLWHENSNIFYFWHENSNEVIFYISHHHLNLGIKCRCMWYQLYNLSRQFLKCLCLTSLVQVCSRYSRVIKHDLASIFPLLLQHQRHFAEL